MAALGALVFHKQIFFLAFAYPHRLAGEEWLLTGETQDVYYPVVGEVKYLSFHHTIACLILSQTSPGFYVSAVQVF